MVFKLPIERVTQEEVAKGIRLWQTSSRIDALVSGSSKSIGASCNTFSVDDSIASIAEGHAWAYHVLSYQGAPSVDFSKLRPRNSKLGSGGKSSGAVSFVQPFDAIVSTMRREEKKNGAGIAYLDWKHPDLDEFLSLPSKAAYKAVYIPMHDTEEAEEFLANQSLVEKLAKAYNEFKCFLVKRPLPSRYGEPLLVNLCTEVEIPHKGFCVLGAVNLSQVSLETLYKLPEVFVSASLQMLEHTKQAQLASIGTSLECNSLANYQFGLGVYGLSSLLGALGVSYEQLAQELDLAFYLEDANVTIHELLSNYETLKTGSKAYTLVYWLLRAYSESTKALENSGIRAAFCIQPTVSTAQRSFDAFGYHASPEIQPVIGLRHSDAVTTVIKSEIKGDKIIDYHLNTPTTDDVPYSIYAEVSSYWQRVLDSTGLAHRHSHCFYGHEFTSVDLRDLYVNDTLKHRKSLYYRLPWQVNTESLDKAQLWQTVDEGELVDFDVDALLSGAQVPGSIECACQM